MKIQIIIQIKFIIKNIFKFKKCKLLIKKKIIYSEDKNLKLYDEKKNNIN